MVGGQPRKQRLFRFTAPLHVRQNFVHAHVDKAARLKLGIKTKHIQLRKGDTVKVMAGGSRGKTGKVTAVNLKSGKIMIDSVTRKNARGKEHGVSISANNVYITEFNLEDKLRAKKLGQAKAAAPVAKTEAAPAAK